MQVAQIGDPSFFSPLQSKAKFTSEFISKAQALSIQKNPLQVLNTHRKVTTKKTSKLERESTTGSLPIL